MVEEEVKTEIPKAAEEQKSETESSNLPSEAAEQAEEQPGDLQKDELPKDDNNKELAGSEPAKFVEPARNILDKGSNTDQPVGGGSGEAGDKKE